MNLGLGLSEGELDPCVLRGHSNDGQAASQPRTRYLDVLKLGPVFAEGEVDACVLRGHSNDGQAANQPLQLPLAGTTPNITCMAMVLDQVCCGHESGSVRVHELPSGDILHSFQHDAGGICQLWPHPSKPW